MVETVSRQLLAGRVVLPGLTVLLLTGPSPATEPTGGGRKVPAAASAELRALYKQRCQRCHEADGTGDGTDAPNFANVKWQRTRSDAQLLVSLLDGKGTAMPAFRGKVTEAQGRELVAFVRAFAGDPAAGANDFRVRFRMLQEELEALRKQFLEMAPPPRRAAKS